ncbi:hypothetical protein PYK79_36325 [Streptomyces sp. ID05-04B]|uniref:hypothetical protein n=1 Tax=unclassified Streptomyces TaxID=2593676 RepID=UPI000D1AF1CA|nr:MULTISPECIES: hypothetical protein [unclassified Streptomyces]AVV46399.1 hypothetical protein C6376_38660 [Streptomyces sp. P3]MDX5567664.1 hypothetical protein [Streptomyces sp. ID05-04B]
MRISRLFVSSGLGVAAAAALPLALAAGPAAARASGISVSTTGSMVSVVTSACTQINGSWGTAALLTSGQGSFAQGRQVALSGTAASQSAAWSAVSPGTYTVVVMCSNGSTAGTQSVIVSTPSTPAPTPTTSPSRGVMGGLGGAARDYGTVTMAVGGALVGAGVIAVAWFLRRRSKPYRL